MVPNDDSTTRLTLYCRNLYRLYTAAVRALHFFGALYFTLHGQLEFISPQQQEQTAHPHQMLARQWVPSTKRRARLLQQLLLLLLHHYKCKIGLYSFASSMKKMKSKKTKVRRSGAVEVHVHWTNKPDISCCCRWALNWDRRQWRLHYKGKHIKTHKSSNLVKALLLQPLLVRSHLFVFCLF